MKIGTGTYLRLKDSISTRVSADTGMHFFALWNIVIDNFLGLD